MAKVTAEQEHDETQSGDETAPKIVTGMVIQEKSGRELFVSSVIGGAAWCTFERKDTGSLKRIKSKYLPERDTREEAEADLYEYARKTDCVIVQGGAELLKAKLAEPLPKEPEPGTPQADPVDETERMGDHIKTLDEAVEIMHEMTATRGWQKLYSYMRDQINRHMVDLKTEDKAAELHRLQARIAVLESLMTLPCAPVAEFNEFVGVKMPLYTAGVNRRARWEAETGLVTWTEKD